MTDFVGGTFPVPAKRVTSIDSSVIADGLGPFVPARPAPAVPAHRTLPPVPSRNIDEKSNPPPPPSRPSVPFPPTPSKPPNKPALLLSDSVRRRRPEITIMSARPMSEVGFRGGKTTPPTSKGPAGADQPPFTKPSRPQAPSPKTVSSASRKPVPSSNQPDAELLINFDDEVATIMFSHPKSSAGPPPVPGRPSVPSPDSESPRRAPDMSSTRGPPPPVPKHPPMSPNDFSDRSPPMPLGAPPSVPRQLPASPKAPIVPPPRPQGVPPPVSRNLPLGRKSTWAESPTNILTNDLATNSSESNRNIDVENTNDSATKELDSQESTDGMYAVINKPKRPTIIRPGRPLISSNDASESRKPSIHQNESEVMKPITPTTRPGIPRRTADMNEVPAHTDLSTNTTKDVPKPVNEASDNSVPDFLKLRLRTTVVDGTSATDNVSPASGPAARAATENETRDVHSETKAPPPAMKPKPKPAVKPKPVISTKPTTVPNVSGDSGGRYVKDVGSFLMQKEQSTTHEKDEISTRGQSADSKSHINELIESIKHSTVHFDDSKGIDTQTDTETVKPIKPSGFKRPTIIRAGRNVQSENDDASKDVKDSDLNKNQNTFSESTDDNVLHKRSPFQPNLPSKRPVSMVNIPSQIAAQEETTHMSTSQSMDIAMERRAIPRPVARGRPASMSVPNTRPPPPSSHRKPDPDIHEQSSPPLRPQSRPPPPRTRGSPENDEKQLSESSEQKRTHRPKIIGVSVLPMLNKGGKCVSGKGDKLTSERPVEEDFDSRPPAKPERRPPPQWALSQHEEDSSDEEFVSALDKPSRPTPPRAKASPESREEKPARPSGPPPPRKASLDMPRKEAETSLVKMRPSRPEGKPARPLSMPVKVEETATHGRPSQPAASKTKSKDSQHLPARPGPGHPLYHYMMQVPHGIALYDYMATRDDELTIQEGDVITLVRAIDEEWIVGQVSESEGMFPRSFVKVKMPLPGETMEDDDSSESESEMFYDAASEKPDTLGRGPRCRARFDFDGQGQQDLTFEEGDVFRLVERVGLEWRKGEINGHVGLFPLSFVEVIEDLPPDGSTNSTSRVVTAMFDFQGDPNELNFSKGQTISVQYRVDEEWLYGESRGREGQFPIQFIDHVPPDLPQYPKHKAPESSVIANSDPIAAAMSAWGDDDATDGPPTSGQLQVADSHWKSPHTEASYCIALFDFTGETDSDLSFVVGDRIELLERVGADWLKGRLGRTTGMFPTAFVEIHEVGVDGNEDSGSCDKPPAKTIYGLVQHDFHAEAANEISLRVGDRVELLERVEGAADWQWGRLNGHKGIFPAVFVTVQT